MNKSKIVVLPLAVLLAAATVPSAFAATISEQHVKQSSDRLVTLPASTALIIRVGNTVQLDASSAQVQNHPLTLFLAEPIIDRSGAIAAQVGAPVVGRLVATEDGIKIALDSVVMGGRVVKVQASSSIIPTQTATRQVANNNGPNFGENVVEAIFGISIASQPQVEEFQVIQINSGTTYILALDDEVSVSLPEVIETQSTPSTAVYSTEERLSSPPPASIFPNPGNSNPFGLGSSYPSNSNSSSQACAQYRAEYARYRAMRDYQNQTAGTLGAQGIYYENAPTPPIAPPGC